MTGAGALTFFEMFGFGSITEQENAAEERDKATDQLAAPTEDEFDDLKLHARRCGLRYYQTRAEIRYARMDIKQVRAEVAGIRLLLILMMLVMVLGGNSGLVVKLMEAFVGK